MAGVSLKQMIVVLSCCAGMQCASPPRPVALAINFTGQGTSSYALQSRINGAVYFADSGYQSFSTAAACTLTATPSYSDTAAISLKAGSVSIISNVMSADEIENLRQQVSTTTLTLERRDGYFFERETAGMPVVAIGQWDLLRTLVKIVPALPTHAVRPGYTWDRERQFPVETQQGKAIGHLYQSFKLDSISNSGQAHVHWLFTFRLEMLDVDTVNVLQNVPQSGSGDGRAIIGINDGSLIKALVNFAVPKTGSDALKMDWKETVVLKKVISQ